MSIEKAYKFEDQAGFIRKFEPKIKPMIENDEALLNVFAKITGEVNQLTAEDKEISDKIIEKFETKMFVKEKDETGYEPDAKRILLSSSDPLSFITMDILAKLLSEDRRCKGIGLVADGVAGRSFDKLFKAQERGKLRFSEIRAGKTYKDGDDYDKHIPAYMDILQAAGDKGFDIALLNVESVHSPSGSLLMNAKANLGAKKLFIVFDGWGAGRRDLMEMIGKSPDVDGIFCNDELAKNMILSLLDDAKEKYRDKIFTTGTPVLDALETDKKEEYARSGREKLGISLDEKVILFLGDISSPTNAGQTGLNENFNEITFEKTLNSIANLSQENPQKKFVLLVRPHPRDPRKDELKMISAVKLPDNMKVVFSDNLDIQESVYSSDIVTSIRSTENFLAKLRGKKAVFLAFAEKGLGKDIINKNYSEEMVKIMANDQDRVLVEDENALKIKLSRLLESPQGESADPGASHTGIMLKKIFE